MKTFYTERDIVDIHAKGVAEIEIDDDVVLTDLAREKAIALGVNLRSVTRRSSQSIGLSQPVAAFPQQLSSTGAAPAPSLSPTPSVPSVTNPTSTEPDLAAQVKAAVIARLGTNEHSDLLDRIIPQILARLCR